MHADMYGVLTLFSPSAASLGIPNLLEPFKAMGFLGRFGSSTLDRGGPARRTHKPSAQELARHPGNTIFEIIHVTRSRGPCKGFHIVGAKNWAEMRPTAIVALSYIVVSGPGIAFNACPSGLTNWFCQGCPENHDSHVHASRLRRWGCGRCCTRPLALSPAQCCATVTKNWLWCGDSSRQLCVLETQPYQTTCLPYAATRNINPSSQEGPISGQRRSRCSHITF
jgi:hypothetical protein